MKEFCNSQIVARISTFASFCNRFWRIVQCIFGHFDQASFGC